MKINVLRNLMLPWVFFFLGSIAVFVAIGVRFHITPKEHPLFLPIMLGLVVFCLVLNIRTLQKAGIWIAYSLPLSLRFTSRYWILRAFIAVGIAYGFYAVGQMPWVPLLWHAFVIPGVFALALFVMIRSLMGPILKIAANIAFGRFITFLFSVPIFLAVPVTATFLGETIVRAYQASRPELVNKEHLITQQVTPVAPVKVKETPAKLQEEALKFQALAEGGKPCPDASKEITSFLEPKGSEEVVYWAVKAVRCAEMKSVVALPKLTKIMVDHPSPKVRAAAIRMLPRFGAENVKRIAYLLVKRISEKEAPEVVEAAVDVLMPLGDDERKWTFGRLKSMLDSTTHSGTIAARILATDLKHEDMVAEYVISHLNSENGARDRAVGMICFLSKASQAQVESQIDNIVASIKNGEKTDPAVSALQCLGSAGFQAIRKEVLEPKRLDKVIAARALAEMKVADKDALETADSCVRDSNEEVRSSCSRSLGQIGTPALPKIIDLLKSSDPALKNAGKNALGFFDDPAAKEELQRIRADNSGWMANKGKLQIAEAVDMALIKIEKSEQSSKKE